jgi:hypothetical protein
MLVAGCADEGGLSGSLGDVYRLDYDVVRARLYSSELSVEYVTASGSVPVRVTLRVRDVELEGREYDLVAHGDVTGRNADGSEIPRFTEGVFELDEFAPETGATVAGSFDASFASGRDTLSLSGSFDTSLEVVDWPPQPAPAP